MAISKMNHANNVILQGPAGVMQVGAGGRMIYVDNKMVIENGISMDDLMKMAE